MTVDIEPMFFVQRGDFTHPPARRVFNSRLTLKCRIDHQKSVINRSLVFIKQNFNSAKALIN
jgi:hypothetical protein